MKTRCKPIHGRSPTTSILLDGFQNAPSDHDFSAIVSAFELWDSSDIASFLGRKKIDRE
jgi:hypothetical protein